MECANSLENSAKHFEELRLWRNLRRKISLVANSRWMEAFGVAEKAFREIE